MKEFVPHDQLTDGYWYLRVDYKPYYTIVSLTRFVLGPKTGQLGVWMFDEEGDTELEAFADDQFIGPVQPPLE
jgi:hypothetical protein